MAGRKRRPNPQEMMMRGDLSAHLVQEILMRDEDYLDPPNSKAPETVVARLRAWLNSTGDLHYEDIEPVLRIAEEMARAWGTVEADAGLGDLRVKAKTPEALATWDRAIAALAAAHQLGLGREDG